ncbi:MAG: tRNA-specific 2-thiouridylase [Deltaproteobacteria bacterium]|jgi:tRNA-specific 2-thiouridylase|nr:tRNA-specific 2-thiouridylase [Deltaproteobacteria bacterium]
MSNLLPDRLSNQPLAVALSGGADSLYSLLELKRSGAEVFGLHALFLPPRLRRPDYAAMLARLEKNCAALNVPFYLADLTKAFEDLVITPFVRAYAKNLTPNPCAGCNRDLKFGLLWAEAARLGARGLVTGHYARMAEFADAGGPRPGLLNGLDAGKDQSYFLALTPLEQLQRAHFPLGGRKKSEILAELAALGVEVPQAGESQEICFIPGNDYRAFLRSFAEQGSHLEQQKPDDAEIAQKDNLTLDGPGPVALYTAPGRIIGRHQGLWSYTEGQRHGLGIAWSEPLYVLGKNVASNTLLVGVKSDFEKADCFCGSLNFLLPFSEWPQNLLVKTRYRQAPRPARASLLASASARASLLLAPDSARVCLHASASAGASLECGLGEDLLRLEFLDETPAPPSAPGQVAAIYAPCKAADGSASRDLRLLAGGLIVRG